MIFRQRPKAPDCLTEEYTYLRRYRGNQNQIAWGLQYRDKRNNTALSNTFQWAKYKGQRVNQIIEDDLKNMTQNHCAFCDIFPLYGYGHTIEHFEPKGIVPEKSHLWSNLFYCCNGCQSIKLENFDPYLLKPDSEEYNFDQYFVVTFDREAIFLKPNPRSTLEEQRRTQTTINLYGLNEYDRPIDRYRVWFQNKDKENSIINELPFRFLFR